MKKVYSVLILLWLVCLTGCTYEHQPREIADAVLDSQQVMACVYDTYGISAEEYVPVHISAVLGTDHRGEWRIQLARKGTERPDYIFVTVNTDTHQVVDYSTASYDTKLAKHFPLDDILSAEEALDLAEQALSEKYDVVFSRIEMSTINEGGLDAPLWDIKLDRAFFVRTNAKTGEILSAET